jgi:hypothetical protein
MTDKPSIANNLNGYVFSWEAYGIAIHAKRIHLHSSDGHVTGEIFVEATTDKGTVIIYPPTSYNFSADRTRRELARSLGSKNGKLPWADMIEQLCYGVQERVRKGDAVLELCTATNVQPPEYIIKPLVVKNYPNVIFGDPSSSKSTVAVILAQIALLPWADNPMGLTAPKVSIKVLYLDWEADDATILWQTTLLQRGISEMPEMFLAYRHCSAPLAQDIDQIKAHIADTKAELVIIDSLGLAAGGELKDSQAPLSFYGALRSLNITSLIIAHNSKDREAKTRSIYGNQYFTVHARNVWELRKQQEVGSKEMAIALFHRKPPPFAGLHQPLGFKLEFTTTAMIVKPSDPKTVGEFLEQMSLKDQIIETLKTGSMSTKDLAETLDRPANQVKARCNELRGQQKLTKIGDEWGLLATVQ